jgi:hypothetical protein
MRCHKCILSVVIMASCLNIVCDTNDQLATLAKVVGKMRHLRRLIGTMRHLAILTCNKVCADLMSYAEFVLWLCACKKIERR